MKKRFTNILSLILSVLVLTTVVSQSGHAQGLQLQQGLTVFDAKGNKVGSVLRLDAPFSASVAFTFEKRLIVAGVTRDHLGLPPSQSQFVQFGGALLFESVGCLGRPFSEFALSTDPTLTPLNWFVGSRVYMPDGPAQTVSVKSQMFGNGGCISFDTQRGATPLKFLVDLESYFQPPFAVK
jgi:hypothetical protein